MHWTGEPGRDMTRQSGQSDEPPDSWWKLILFAICMIIGGSSVWILLATGF